MVIPRLEWVRSFLLIIKLMKMYNKQRLFNNYSWEWEKLHIKGHNEQMFWITTVTNNKVERLVHPEVIAIKKKALPYCT